MPSLFNNQYKNLASKGRYGDTMLAHINPKEAALLKSMGGAGTINPKTGLREFYGMNTFGDTWKTLIAPPPPPSLGQALAPEAVQADAQNLPKVTVPAYSIGGYGAMSPASEQIAPEYKQYADLAPSAGYGAGQQTLGYTVPTDQTFQGQPLVAKYDAQGNFKNFTMEGNNFLTPDPSQPNIIAQPTINAKGELIDYGVFDVTADRGGGFGDFLGGFVEDFGPMIALGLGANALLGSGLLGGGAAAPAAGGAVGGGALSPYAAQAAGAYGGSSAAAAAAAAGNLAGISEAAAAQNALTQAAINGTGITFGQGGTPTATPTNTTTPPTNSGGYPAAPTGIPPVVSAAGSSITPSMLQSISDATGISVDTLKTFGPSVIQGLIGAGGSILTSEQAKTAAQTQADAQVRAAQIAADAARFRPVGVTTRFGTSNFTTDAAGNIVTAGYTPTPEITSYQDRLKTLAGQGMTDVEAARTAYQPLTTAAQSLFTLGKGYFAKSPEEAAQDYITKQTALLTPSRENQLAELRNRQFQTGRTGVATAQGGNLMNTSPELAAYYNSLAQQDLVLAANADQEARNRIQFGAGLFDTGAGLQGKYYTGQTAAYSPFTTAIDTSSGLERLAQQPLDLSTSIGQKVSTANANVGQLTGQGIINAAGTMAPANAYSLGGNLLSGAASSPVLSSAVNKAFGNTQPTQQQYTFNPQTGQYVPVSQSVWI